MADNGSAASRLDRAERDLSDHDRKIDDLAEIAHRADERIGRLAEDLGVLKDEVTEWRRDEAERHVREREREEAAEEAEGVRRTSARRFQITTTIAIVMAILAAAAIVASAL